MLTMIKYGIFEIKCCNMLHFVNYQYFFKLRCPIFSRCIAGVPSTWNGCFRVKLFGAGLTFASDLQVPLANEWNCCRCCRDVLDCVFSVFSRPGRWMFLSDPRVEGVGVSADLVGRLLESDLLRLLQYSYEICTDE